MNQTTLKPKAYGGGHKHISWMSQLPLVAFLWLPFCIPAVGVGFTVVQLGLQMAQVKTSHSALWSWHLHTQTYFLSHTLVFL